MNKLFFFKDLDAHYIIYFFGIRLCFKHKYNFDFKEVTKSGVTSLKRDKKIIVSLTSYPLRINTARYAISTLLNQTCKPDMVILWLSEEEFPNGLNDLPKELVNLTHYGLTIEWTKDNIRSYKKLVPALNKYPNDIIITADDDVFYSENMVESLYNEYLKDPANIYVRRSVKLTLEDDHIKNVSSRKYLYNHLKTPSYFNQIMGGSGCLYPPGALYKDSVNIENIKCIVPTHDDAYFWAMAVLNKTKIKVVGGFNEDLLFVDGTQSVGLINTNKSNSTGVSLNEAYDILFIRYPQILKNIKEEKHVRRIEKE